MHTMWRRTAALVAGVGVVAAVAVSGAALASNRDREGTLTGAQAQRATAAALQATQGGHAKSVERDTENGATWEVEVTRPNGQTVDVRLGERYGLVVIEGDFETH
jgi:hypothetical protein